MFWLQPDLQVKEKVKIKDKKQTQEKRAIFCAQCQTLVSWPEQKITVNDKHCHVFFNPHGYVFEIGCFKKSKCLVTGRPETNFSWFPPYAWEIALCPNCYQHLGWRFSKEEDYFWGLILNRLAEN